MLQPILGADNLGITCRIIDMHGNHALFVVVVVVNFQPSGAPGSQLTFSIETPCTAKRALRSQPEPVLNTPLYRSHTVCWGSVAVLQAGGQVAYILRDTDFDFEIFLFACLRCRVRILIHAFQW